MNRTLELVLVGLLVLIVGLATLARRFPHIGRLQAFRRALPHGTHLCALYATHLARTRLGSRSSAARCASTRSRFSSPPRGA